jgi:hypothetical protein
MALRGDITAAGLRRRGISSLRGAPKHDPEKWKPVFRKDHASPKRQSAQLIQSKAIARWR